MPAVAAAAAENRNKGCRPPVFFIAFIVILVTPLLFLSARDRRGISTSNKQIVGWREQIIKEHLKSVLTKEVIDSISIGRDNPDPWSLDLFRGNLVPSWQVDGRSDPNQDKSTAPNVAGSARNGNQQPDAQDKLARRQLRGKRREKRAMELVQQDEEALVKLENAAIERSKAVDSAVLGKYSIWRKENENENSDSTVRLIRDQMTMARVYSFIAKSKNKLDLHQDLLTRLKESQRTLGEANTDADLHHAAPEKMKSMGQALSKARAELYNCKSVTQQLRAIILMSRIAT